MGRHVIDRAGKRYGRLVALEPAPQRRGDNRGGNLHKGGIPWRCRCDCGRYAVVKGFDLGKNTNSCGCLRSERALALTRGHARVLVVAPDGTPHPSIAAASLASGIPARTLGRRCADPASGWRRAA